MRLISICAAGTAIMFGGSIAAAQAEGSSGDAPPEVVAELFKCRDIAEADARLACFDREVGRVFAAQESKELVIADREQVKEARRGLFGLKLPDLGIFGSSDDEDAMDRVTAKLIRTTKLRNGRYILEIEGGARWIQTQDLPGYRRYEAGDEIVIRRAAMGSFSARVNGKNAGKVRRLN